MRRLLVALLAVLAFSGAARAETFTVLSGARALPGADAPNQPGSVPMPFAISTPPDRPMVLSYDQLLALWQHAGEAYGIPWQLLASINQIESDFGRGMGPSSAGAVGWMQFLPSTWADWGVDANGDGIADPWNPTDAVYAAARYLAATGAHDDLQRAVFAYNHSQDYVDAVMAGAARFAADPLGAGFGLLTLPTSGPSIPELEAELEAARQRAAGLTDRIPALESGVEQAGWDLDAAIQKAGDPSLSDAEFQAAQAAVTERDQALAQRRAELDQARLELQEAAAEVTRLEQEVAIARVETGSGSLDGLLPAPPTEAAGRVIDYAVSQLGVPYQWGGNHGFSLEQMIESDPNLAYGFDCSSFLAWSFAKGAQLYIGDWTVAQWEYGVTAAGATRGPEPAQNGAEPPGGYLPGDIIFFNDTDHVGLYIGNDLFVQAPRTGDVVKISRLSTYNPVWGWVRYSQISGVEQPEAGPDAAVPATARPVVEPGDRVFEIVVEPAPDDGSIVLFARD